LFGVGLEKDLTDATTASVVLQTALDAETREHTVLQNAAGAVCDALVPTQQILAELPRDAAPEGSISSFLFIYFYY
jgi:hypothetical protein